MDIELRIKRFNPEADDAPHWETYALVAEPSDRVLDLLHQVKWYQDGTLTFRRSCAHGVCGSDAMLINGRNRLACEYLVRDAGTRISVEALKGVPMVKDLLVDMDGFMDKYRAVMPFLVSDSVPDDGKERRQSPAERQRYDDTSKCILCAGLHDRLPRVLDEPRLRRSGGDRQRPPLHHGQPRRGTRRASRDHGRCGRRVALPHGLQLRRGMPARHQRHARHLRGHRRDRAPAWLTACAC